jgi:isopentenyl-diphosphate delta-isomerase
MALNQNDEILDEVDENDTVIGQKPRSFFQSNRIWNYRVINAFIVNNKGELWIPRRSANKRIFPLCLDMSVGGHVETGESYDDAFRRETKEETGIDIDSVPHRLLGYITPKDIPGFSFMNVYEIKYDAAPDYNKNDFTEYYWLTPQALLERVKNGDKPKGHLMELIRRFYLSK